MQRRTRRSSEIIVTCRLVIDLLNPVDELFRLPRDLESHWRQAVVMVLQPCRITDAFALGVGVKEPGPAVRKRAHDRLGSISKRRIPCIADGCLG